MRSAPRRRAGIALLSSFLAASATAGESALWKAGTVTLQTSGSRFTVTTEVGRRQIELPTGVAVEELFAVREGALLSARQAAGTGGAAGTELYLARLDAQGLHPLPAPARPGLEADARPLQRENAVPLLSAAGDLEGLVWLEGAERRGYALRYAGWTGMSWTEPRTVAERAPGSQLALAAATLDDGSRLLVWSRFDGQDDEIVALRERNGSFGEQFSVGGENSVPDIQPAVVAVPGGALVAWSRFDGHDYRIVTSRFDGSAFGAPAWSGPKGSTYPMMSLAAAQPESHEAQEKARRETIWVTYASASPRGWGIAELDTEGRALRRGVATAVSNLRPVFVPPGATGEPRLRWADAETGVALH